MTITQKYWCSTCKLQTQCDIQPTGTGYISCGTCNTILVPLPNGIDGFGRDIKQEENMKVHKLGSPKDKNPKTRQEVVDKLDEIKKQAAKHETLREELKNLINFHSLENESDTTDIILADYLLDCLAAFNKATRDRKMFE